MKYCTCVIPFAYTPRWGQIVIASLKEHKNALDFDILLMNNSPEKNYVGAIAETSLGEGVKIHVPPLLQRWHGGALDCGIGMVETPYFFSLETDCTLNRDGWLDWYAGFMRDEYVAMAGWFWELGEKINDGRHYINSSATLYSTRVLKQLLEESRNNKDEVLLHGMRYENRVSNDNFAKIVREGFIGPFCESRGFQHHNYPIPRPEKWWHEPGNWLFNRISCQWEYARVPGKMVASGEAHAPESKYNYYGNSEAEAYAFHYWGGTVSHNYDKHLVSVNWEADCIEWWLKREHRIWTEVVPESIRKESLEKGLVRTLEEDLRIAMNRVHILKPGDLVRVYHGDATPYISKEAPEPSIPGDALNARVVAWDHGRVGWLVEFDEKPCGIPYKDQHESGGKSYAVVHAQWCVKR